MIVIDERDADVVLADLDKFFATDWADAVSPGPGSDEQQQAAAKEKENLYSHMDEIRASAKARELPRFQQTICRLAKDVLRIRRDLIRTLPFPQYSLYLPFKAGSTSYPRDNPADSSAARPAPRSVAN